MKKIIRNIFAVISLIIGFLGGFIPVLQGWVFVLIGFILIDFKQKYVWEAKIIDVLDKFKLGRKLTSLWARVKFKNKDVSIDKGSNITSIYKKINKNADK